MNDTQNSSKELHVVFGTGPVGLTLADMLLAKGKQVRLVNRSGRTAVPDGAELIASDATDSEKVKELSRGAAALYHCANVPYAEQYEAIPRLQKALIAGAASAGAKLIVTDTLYMYGETHGVPMTENMPYAATTRKGQMRAQVARDYLQAHRNGTVQVALGRAADFFGPRVFNSALGDRAFPPALAGKPVQVLGNPSLLHSFSYIGDVAHGLATLGEHPEALGHEWLLPVAPAVTTDEIVRLIGEAVGHPVEILALPKLALETMGLHDVQMREMVEMFYQYTEPQIVDSHHFEETFGWSATPLPKAISATVAWFRGQQK